MTIQTTVKGCKSIFFLIILCLFLPLQSVAQLNPIFTWMSGSNQVDRGGVYGEMGIVHPDNVPGSRLTSISWTDPDGNLWLFGGYGADKSNFATFGQLNDLWMYDMDSGYWAWKSGANVINQPGVYGEKGVPDPINIPGARFNSISSIGPDGNLWLFGGLGIDTNSNFSRLNDLWMYNLETGNWTWKSGADIGRQLGEYGEKGVEHSDNVPSARQRSISWTGPDGNLWLFGGNSGDTDGNFGAFNDLWKYDKDSGNWTWISGSDEIGQPGVYGDMGVANSSNVPGARESSITWTGPDGNLWLLGGWGYDTNGDNTGRLNDLWMYNLETDNWTWKSGDNTINQPGEYGTKGVEHSDNIPGARLGSISWTGPDGNLWLLGGMGYDTNGDNTGRLNDLWMYNLETDNWTWKSGDNTINQPGEYGTKGVAHPDNLPRSRDYSISWTGLDGNLWLFGGFSSVTHGSSGSLNDLWQIITFPANEPPELLNPVNGEIDTEFSLTLQWAENEFLQWAEDGFIVSYTIQLSTDSDFESGVIVETGIENLEFTVSGLEELTTYYWRVRAIGTDIEGKWSEVWNFTTKEQLLETPQLVSPENSATEIALNPVLSWEESALAVTFTLQIATDENFQSSLSQIGNIEDTEIELTGLNEHTQYFWRVKALGEEEETGWSDVWTFTTKQLSPDIPSLLSPENGADEVVLTPILSWQESAPEVSYTLKWSQDETFDSSFNQEGGLTETEFELPELAELTQYFWRVKAVGNDIESDWSETWNFTTMMATSINLTGIPEQFELSQNYPNPFNPTTQINYSVPEQTHVQLVVYNSIGQRVATLVNETKSPGRYEVSFDASGHSSGLYLYRFQTGSHTETRQMLLVK